MVSVLAPNRDGGVADLAGAVPFADSGVIAGYTGLRPDADGTIRHFTVAPAGVQAFPLAATAAFLGRRVLAPANALIDFPGGDGTVPRVSYADVMNGRFDKTAIRGRIVVVGSTATVLSDRHHVATSPAMAGAEIHADAIATALAGFPLRIVPAATGRGLATLVAFLVALLALAGARRSPLGAPLAAGVLVAAAWLVAAQVAFAHGAVVEVVPGLVASIVASALAAGLAHVTRQREHRRIRECFAAADPGILAQVLASRARRGGVTASDIISGYTIVERLGGGGMGEVYRATQQRLERPVALKLIHSRYALDRRYRERFVAEAHRAAAVTHPNIVPVHDAGESDGVLYIALQLVAGGNLAERAEAVRRRGSGHIVRVLHRVACALDAAHAAGLVHRDVKPENILLPDVSPEHPLLTDFGVARAAGDTATGAGGGTRRYLAPERSAGLRDDTAADVYALTARALRAAGRRAAVRRRG